MSVDPRAAIRERALALGFDLCRFAHAQPPDHLAAFQRWLDAGAHGEMAYLMRQAEKRADIQKVLAGARSVIVLGVNYNVENPSAPHGAPRGEVARYARFADYHHVLAERLQPLADFVESLAGDGRRALWYVDTGPLLERDLAQRAGLGFVGKHTNLISRELGNWIFLAEILTTLEIEPDPPEKNRCGSCARCIAACPTSAITAPFQLDARRCISYLTIELKGSIPEEFRPAIGNRIYGCDDCLAVCPWNRFAKESQLMKAHYRAELAAPELLELLELDDAGFKKKFAGTPMLRAKRRGFLRNVCVALGNVGEASALPALARAATDAEPLIAEHARWAMGQVKKKEAKCS
jgi:epoxyqueuosine reductase